MKLGSRSAISVLHQSTSSLTTVVHLRISSVLGGGSGLAFATQDYPHSTEELLVSDSKSKHDAGFYGKVLAVRPRLSCLSGRGKTCYDFELYVF